MLLYFHYDESFNHVVYVYHVHTHNHTHILTTVTEVANRLANKVQSINVRIT